MYRYEGGDVFNIGTISGLWNFDSLLKRMRAACARISGFNLTIYALFDGIRSRVDDTNDLAFHWEILPTDEDGFTHLYCITDFSNNLSSPLPPVVSSEPIEVELNSPLPPVEPASEVDTNAPLSFTNFILTHFGSPKAKATPPHKLAVKRKLTEIVDDSVPTQQSQGNCYLFIISLTTFVSKY